MCSIYFKLFQLFSFSYFVDESSVVGLVGFDIFKRLSYVNVTKSKRISIQTLEEMKMILTEQGT